MSLQAHRVIDALLGKDRRVTITLEWPHMTGHRYESFALAIRQAEKFDFGLIPLEGTEEQGHYTLPGLTEEEIGFWRDGLVPLPSPLTYLEAEFPHSDDRMIMLIQEKGTQWFVWRWDLMTGPKGKQSDLYVDPTIISIDRADTQKGWWNVKVEGDTDVMNGLEEKYGPKKIEDHYAQLAPLSIYLIMMLYSRTTELVKVDPPPKLVKAQQARGDTVLPPHRIVTIVPGKYYQAARAEGETDRRAPRLHWRRAHLRHFDHQTPNSQWKSNEVWKDQVGWWVTLVPRELVGKRELGEVSHTYKIKGPK